MVKIVTNYTVNDWVFRSFDDGTQQWRFAKLGAFNSVFVERVVGPKSRRKRWRVVDRRPRNLRKETLYPPTIGPPFKESDQAKTAFLVMLSAGLLDPTDG